MRSWLDDSRLFTVSCLFQRLSGVCRAFFHPDGVRLEPNLSKRTTPIMKYFPVHVKSQRTAKGWDQETLAHMAGVSSRTIQRIEAGNPCKLETLKNIAAALDVTHFSALLPAPKKCDEKPTLSALFNVVFSELVFRNFNRAILLAFAVIGFLTFAHLSEESKSLNKSIEQVAQERFDLHQKLSSELIRQNKEVRTLDDYITEVESERNYSYTASDYEQMLTVMFYVFLAMLALSSLYSIFSKLPRKETYYLRVIKPCEDKLEMVMHSVKDRLRT